MYYSELLNIYIIIYCFYEIVFYLNSKPKFSVKLIFEDDKYSKGLPTRGLELRAESIDVNVRSPK